MSVSERLSRGIFPVMVATAVALGACGSDPTPQSSRPSTTARLEITSPAPNETTGPNVTLTLNLIGARVVPPENTKGPLRGDEGHIHVTLDGKLISMAYSTSQDLKDLPPGPHAVQAEFVATDHAPFRNRVLAAVAFQVVHGSAPASSPS